MVWDATGRVGFRCLNEAAVELWAHAGGDGAGVYREGEDQVVARVSCSSGDDSFAMLTQRQMLSDDKMTVTERGRLELYQQRSHRGPDGLMSGTDLSWIEVGHDGVTRRMPGNRVLAYSPLVRVPDHMT